MLLVGSDDGVYGLGDLRGDGSDPRKLLDSDRVMRVRTFDGIEGVFAATASGLYHSPDAEAWTDLAVPEAKVYSVGTSAAGDRLYAGTRPAHVYAAPVGGSTPAELSWTECDGFQALPSREDWRLPRHEDLAQVRDVHGLPDAPDGVVAAVEVGGVHVSEDGGETWTERREGVHDDVHELFADGEQFLAATGRGLYRSTDAGTSWSRLDGGYDQRYFRSVVSFDGRVYAGGALANSSTWDDEDADPRLFVSRDGTTLEPVDQPRPDETVTGFAAVDGQLLAATHRGTVMREDPDDGWTVVGSVPTPGEVTGTYTPLCWVAG